LLFAAANKLCLQTKSNTEDDYASIKILLDAGTGSLGGARPKSSVVDERSDGCSILYLAKFPHPADNWDVMRWEKVALDLAAAAGISVPKNQLLQVDGKNVLLLQRFDRDETGRRIGYMSAMALLESEEGQARDYLDISDALAQVSASASQDLAELWLRILFSLSINNTDDHLRNHAVLRSGSAWRISPAFDLNPDPDLNSHRVTAINGATSFEAGLTMLQETREFFGISEIESTKMIAAVHDAILKGEMIALKYGATKDEIKLFSPVFERSKTALASILLRNKE
jgi:serine/threonine-protein kinase HipA